MRQHYNKFSSESDEFEGSKKYTNIADPGSNYTPNTYGSQSVWMSELTDEPSGFLHHCMLANLCFTVMGISEWMSFWMLLPDLQYSHSGLHRYLGKEYLWSVFSLFVFSY